MYQISDSLLELEYDKLQIQKILPSSNFEVLSISLENGSVFPEHTSPRDAFLVMLEGEMEFHINNKTHLLKKHQTFNFPAEIPHDVTAVENSKFLIIR